MLTAIIFFGLLYWAYSKGCKQNNDVAYKEGYKDGQRDYIIYGSSQPPETGERKVHSPANNRVG